ncbi:hypothetical protein LUX57_31080 [Actinomadura madurae]|uniref:hypothetical protein n=1 Tax=Actinomadura madurae TaxID=1993 RepID=UPI0020D202F2|nr:hypothetical protein [Actinomadura madurae]MCP9969076.1 hypothetical protein [Actinomadura madurae]
MSVLAIEPRDARRPRHRGPRRRLRDGVDGAAPRAAGLREHLQAHGVLHLPLLSVDRLTHP